MLQRSRVLISTLLTSMAGLLTSMAGFLTSIAGQHRPPSLRSLIPGGKSLHNGDILPITDVNKLLVGISYTTRDRYPTAPSLSCLVPDINKSVQVVNIRDNRSLDGGVYYHQDACVDEFSREVAVQLEHLSQQVVFALHNSRWGPRSQIRSVTIHLTDFERRELMRFTMPWADDFAARAIARIYKQYGKWHFHAIGGCGGVLDNSIQPNIAAALAQYIE